MFRLAFRSAKSRVRSLGCGVRPAMLGPQNQIPLIKVLLGGIELAELREGQHTHGQVVAEDLMHSIKESAAGGFFPLFLLFFTFPATHSYFPPCPKRSLLEFWQSTDNALCLNKSNLALQAEPVSSGGCHFPGIPAAALKARKPGPIREELLPVTERSDLQKVEPEAGESLIELWMFLAISLAARTTRASLKAKV